VGDRRERMAERHRAESMPCPASRLRRHPTHARLRRGPGSAAYRRDTDRRLWRRCGRRRESRGASARSAPAIGRSSVFSLRRPLKRAWHEAIIDHKSYMPERPRVTRCAPA
jgi:hypothetical protein